MDSPYMGQEGKSSGIGLNYRTKRPEDELNFSLGPSVLFAGE